jgi:pilus assembly protein CpaB
MKVTRLLVLVVALGAGVVAALLASQMSNGPSAPAPMAMTQAPPPPPPETVDVLVAVKEVPTGKRLEASDLGWQSFPKAGIVEFHLTKAARPTAIQDLTGSFARATFLAGEPMREQRLLKAERGFMSVILGPGMRAAAVEVKAVSTAGGFILPNDHVDVLLTRAATKASGAGGDTYVTETILTNVRVLAVDQQVGDRPEPAISVKDTVTLELTPRQTEITAQAQQLGVISLALRSVREPEGQVAEEPDNGGGPVKVVRAGVTSTVSIRR